MCCCGNNNQGCSSPTDEQPYSDLVPPVWLRGDDQLTVRLRLPKNAHYCSSFPARSYIRSDTYDLLRSCCVHQRRRHHLPQSRPTLSSSHPNRSVRFLIILVNLCILATSASSMVSSQSLVFANATDAYEHYEHAILREELRREHVLLEHGMEGKEIVTWLEDGFHHPLRRRIERHPFKGTGTGSSPIWLHFDGLLAPGQTVVQARLRIHKSLGTSDATVAAYQVFRFPTKRHKERCSLLDSDMIIGGEPEDTPNLSLSANWVDLDVTEAVRGWTQGTARNLGLMVQTDSVAVDLFLFRPILNLVLMNPGSSKNQENLRGRSKRSTTGTSLKYNELISSAATSRPSRDCSSQIGSKTKKPNCCRKDMIVQTEDFKDFLGEILEPKSFNAYACEGSCRRRARHATKHAIMQSWLHSWGIGDARRPCCVPSEMGHLHILYRDQEGKYRQRTWPNAVALHCACA